MAKTWKENTLKLSLPSHLTKRGKNAKPRDKLPKHKCKQEQSKSKFGYNIVYIAMQVGEKFISMFEKLFVLLELLNYTEIFLLCMLLFLVLNLHIFPQV